MIQIPQNLCTDITDEQASTVQGGLTLTIDKITAIKTGADRNEGLPIYLGDDPYIKINGRGSAGTRIEEIKEGTPYSIGRKSNIGSSGTVELVDYDGGGLFDVNRIFRGSDDSLGSFTVNSPTNGQVKKRISGSNSTYDVFYSVSA